MPNSALVNSDLQSALDEARQAYSARNPKSLTRHHEACEAMPGGNTRTTLHYAPFPLTMVRGEGCRLWDARRPRIHRLAGRVHRRHLRPFASGDPRRHRPRAEPRLELRRPQRQRGEARRAGGRPHARRSTWCASPTPAPRPTCMALAGARVYAQRRPRRHQGHGVRRRLPRRRALLRERRQPGQRAATTTSWRPTTTSTARAR